MSVEILTRDDLRAFKSELLVDIQNLITEKTTHTKKWLRTKEVLKLLKISASTLQNYRINGNLKFTRIGRTLYYSLQDIEELFNKNNPS